MPSLSRNFVSIMNYLIRRQSKKFINNDKYIIAATQITNNEIAGMRNFQDTFETRKRPLISAFSIFMIVLFIFQYI